MAQVGVDAVDQRIAHRVLHVLGFFVDFVPGEVERLAQELLDQPVPPQHAQRQRPAGRREPHAFVRRVRGQVALVERLEHARHRAGQHAQRGRDLAGGHGAGVGLLRELVDRLDVVFDGQAGHGGWMLDAGCWDAG